MSIAPLAVAVVGAGTAGAATALLLARAGHDVTLFEAVPEPAPVGAGIMMQLSGLSVLSQLGLLTPVLERGSRLRGLRCVQQHGRPILELSYARLHDAAFGLGLHRGVLFDALFDAATVQAGISLCTGIAIESRERVGTRQRLFTQSGDSAGDFDLVVVANGARSTLRRGCGLTRRDQAYPWGALWCILEDEQDYCQGHLEQVVKGTRQMLGFLPSGLGPSGNTPLVSMFWSVRADQVAATKTEGLTSFKQRLLALAPSCAPLLVGLRDMDQLIFARYHDVVMRPWHLPEGVVFLGDAAHAMSPQLGQGANLALVDAATLANTLATSDSLPLALERYSALRRHELNYYQWATRFLTPFFQSDYGVLAWLRDTFMHPMCRLPFGASKMLRTLCGIERGILLSAAKPLPLLPQAGPPLLRQPAEIET